MKFHRLLAGTAVAALMASNASALNIRLAQASSGSPGTDSSNALTANELITSSPIRLAEESDRAGMTGEGTFAIEVITNSNVASANNYLITLELINGSFATEVAADDLQDGTASVTGVTNNTLFEGTTVQFDGADRTGQEGDTSVRFLSSAVTGGAGFSIVFDAEATCRGDMNVRVSYTTETGTPIEEGTVTLDTPAVQCVDAFQAVVQTDVESDGSNDSILIPPRFRAFDQSVTSPLAVGNDRRLEANVGTISLLFDPDRPNFPQSNARTIFPSLADAEDETSGWIAGAISDIDEVTITVELDETVGIDGIAVRANGGDPEELSAAGSALVAFDPSDFEVPTGQNSPGAVGIAGIEVDIAGSTTLMTTQPVASAGFVSFAGSADGLAREDIVRIGEGELDRLQYTGQSCGTFDWVGDSTTSRRNVFRITNFAGAQTNGILATMTNSSAGLASETLPINDGVTVSGAEMSFTDVLLTDTFGEYGRADFSFNFISATSSLDCDRLQSSPVSSVVTAFGNDSGDFGDGDD